MVEKYLRPARPFEPAESEGIENFDSAADVPPMAADVVDVRASASMDL